MSATPRDALGLGLLGSFARPDLADLRADQLEPLEGLLPDEWPEVWRDFAISLFVTLISLPGADELSHRRLADLALQLTLGLVQDHGGTQPYIASGADLLASSRSRKVIELLDQRLSYRDVARQTGLTVPRVRNIERAWRRDQAARRQMSLALGDAGKEPDTS